MRKVALIMTGMMLWGARGENVQRNEKMTTGDILQQ